MVGRPSPVERGPAPPCSGTDSLVTAGRRKQRLIGLARAEPGVAAPTGTALVRPGGSGHTQCASEAQSHGRSLPGWPPRAPTARLRTWRRLHSRRLRQMDGFPVLQAGQRQGGNRAVAAAGVRQVGGSSGSAQHFDTSGLMGDAPRRREARPPVQLAAHRGPTANTTRRRAVLLAKFPRIGIGLLGGQERGRRRDVGAVWAVHVRSQMQLARLL